MDNGDGDTNENENIEKDIHKKRNARINVYKKDFDFNKLLLDNGPEIGCDTRIYSVFKEELLEYSKSQRRNFYTKEAYNLIIRNLELAKAKQNSRSNDEYYLLRTFGIVDVLTEKLLIEKLENLDSQVKYYVYIEQLFKIIHETHLFIGHYGINATDLAIGEKFVNVPRELIKKYVENCDLCLKKKAKQPRNGLVFKPIISDDFNSRSQMDMIDFQSNPDGVYKWILHYQDHLTKYCLLRACKSKCAKEVAHWLFQIFIDFGAPKILQSDNGREFVAEVILELKKIWPSMLIINGRARHPQSQGKKILSLYFSIYFFLSFFVLID